MLSDHIWLWARGFEGGGPHLDLLRRLSHWLMKQPDLEEEALRLAARGRDLTIERQTMSENVEPVTVTTPSGENRIVTLTQAEPGLWRGSTPANELGLWRATDGKLTTLVNVGPVNPREFAEVTSSTEVLRPLSVATGGDARRLDDNGSLSMPRIVGVRSSETFRGDDWLGLEAARRHRAARYRRAADIRGPARTAAADRIARRDLGQGRPVRRPSLAREGRSSGLP